MIWSKWQQLVMQLIFHGWLLHCDTRFPGLNIWIAALPCNIPVRVPRCMGTKHKAIDLNMTDSFQEANFFTTHFPVMMCKVLTNPFGDKLPEAVKLSNLSRTGVRKNIHIANKEILTSFFNHMIENAALITKGWSCCLLMTLQLYNWRITALILFNGFKFWFRWTCFKHTWFWSKHYPYITVCMPKNVVGITANIPKSLQDNCPRVKNISSNRWMVIQQEWHSYKPYINASSQIK